jgi:DUF971 family protein
VRLSGLRQPSPDTVLLRWDDGHEGPVSLESLRDHCPCASCAGETVLLRSYVPPPPERSVPGRYVLSSAAPVGNYALQLAWGDGHTTVIYTWERLRALCECPSCRAEEGVAGSP